MSLFFRGSSTPQQTLIPPRTTRRRVGRHVRKMTVPVPSYPNDVDVTNDNVAATILSMRWKVFRCNHLHLHCLHRAVFESAAVIQPLFQQQGRLEQLQWPCPCPVLPRRASTVPLEQLRRIMVCIIGTILIPAEAQFHTITRHHILPPIITTTVTTTK